MWKRRKQDILTEMTLPVWYLRPTTVARYKVHDYPSRDFGQESACGTSPGVGGKRRGTTLVREPGRGRRSKRRAAISCPHS